MLSEFIDSERETTRLNYMRVLSNILYHDGIKLQQIVVKIISFGLNADKNTKLFSLVIRKFNRCVALKIISKLN